MCCLDKLTCEILVFFLHRINFVKSFFMGSSHLEKLQERVHLKSIASKKNVELKCCKMRLFDLTTVLISGNLSLNWQQDVNIAKIIRYIFGYSLLFIKSKESSKYWIVSSSVYQLNLKSKRTSCPVNLIYCNVLIEDLFYSVTRSLLRKYGVPQFIIRRSKRLLFCFLGIALSTVAWPEDGTRRQSPPHF